MLKILNNINKELLWVKEESQSREDAAKLYKNTFI